MGFAVGEGGLHLRRAKDQAMARWVDRLDQATYIDEVPVTKVKLQDSALPGKYPELVTEFRSDITSLQWLASTLRGTSPAT